jgi:hypothetical protein
MKLTDEEEQERTSLYSYLMQNRLDKAILPGERIYGVYIIEYRSEKNYCYWCFSDNLHEAEVYFRQFKEYMRLCVKAMCHYPKMKYSIGIQEVKIERRTANDATGKDA